MFSTPEHNQQHDTMPKPTKAHTTLTLTLTRPRFLTLAAPQEIARLKKSFRRLRASKWWQATFARGIAAFHIPRHLHVLVEITSDTELTILGKEWAKASRSTAWSVAARTATHPDECLREMERGRSPGEKTLITFGNPSRSARR